VSAAERGLHIRRLSKTFGAQQALREVDLVVLPGQVHGLLGHNGSGKSTLIRILAGYHHPDPGAAITVNGEAMRVGNSAASRRAGLRFVHQNLAMIDGLTVIENFALTSAYARRPSGRIDWQREEARARQLMHRIGVEVDPYQRVGRCRAVEKTAIAIARALDPHAGPIEVLVLDEPTAALPPVQTELLHQVIEEVSSHGIGVLYVSHRLGEITAWTDQVTVLRDGRSQGSFATADLDRGRVIELIVGRRIEEFQDRSRPELTTDAAPALAITGLRASELHGVDLRVAAGEILGLAGLVGSGRDQVPYAAFGAVPSRCVRMRVGDTELPPRPAPRRALNAGLGLLPGSRDRANAIARFDIRENLTLPVLRRYRRWMRLTRTAEMSAARDWISQLDIRPPLPSRLVGDLSGGNQQKVLIAKWLNINPTVVMLDEPTAGVDIASRTSIYQAISNRAKSGLAFVVSSSDLEELATLCSRVLIFSNGRIVGELARPSLTSARLLASVMATSPALGRNES
jgi:ribose transport system ATP-binding protein